MGRVGEAGGGVGLTQSFSLFVLFTSYPNTVHFLRQRLKRLSLFSTLFDYIYEVRIDFFLYLKYVYLRIFI